MPVYNIFVINRAGSLIYDFDNRPQKLEIEKTLTFPLDFKLAVIDQRVTVTFGERDGIRVGHAILALNSEPVLGVRTAAGEEILNFLATETNFPVNVKFGRPPFTSNEKIILSSMFHSLYAIGSQITVDI